jgi:glycerol uptake facilitator-like aquaporin
MERLHTNNLELGATDALQRHVTRQVVAQKPISQRKLNFEAKRPRTLRECKAEATGVSLYVFPAIASIASFTLNGTSPLDITAFGSLFETGWAFAIGIAFAIITYGSTSGGHFNPAITICFAIWWDFPWRKVPHYVLSQIFRAFIAGLLLMGLYLPEISAF